MKRLMQKSLNKEIKKLLLRFYKVCGDDKISDKKRQKRLQQIRLSLSVFSRKEIVATAEKLSKSPKRAMIFKVWCETIILTGEV